MLWYCRFKWQANTTTPKVRERVLQQHEAGTNHPEKIRGWYNLAGGGAGFLLIETDSLDELTAFLQPYMDLMSWDVRAVSQLDYASEIESLRRAVQQST